MLGRCGVEGSIYIKSEMAKGTNEKGEKLCLFFPLQKSQLGPLASIIMISSPSIQSRRFAPKIHHHCS